MDNYGDDVFLLLRLVPALFVVMKVLFYRDDMCHCFIVLMY